MSYATIAGLVLGAVLVAVYIGHSVIMERPRTLANAGVIFLSTEGLVGGCRLVAFVFDPDLQVLAASRQISLWYIALGGLALIWLSLVSITQPFRDNANTPR